MKLTKLRQKARIKFWLGLIGLIVFGFTTTIAILKALYISFQEMGAFGLKISELIGNIINFIYEYTNSIPLFWDVIWNNLPILNLQNIPQEENYYFFGLLVMTLVSFIQIQDSFWIKGRINKAQGKANDALLENEIRRENGVTEIQKTDTLEIEVNMEGSNPWHKRPLGVISIGLFVVIAGKIILLVVGIDD